MLFDSTFNNGYGGGGGGEGGWCSEGKNGNARLYLTIIFNILTFNILKKFTILYSMYFVLFFLFICLQ